MPYICTLIACDDEKKALREEIARLDKALALGARELIDLEKERDALRDSFDAQLSIAANAQEHVIVRNAIGIIITGLAGHWRPEQWRDFFDMYWNDIAECEKAKTEAKQED